MTLLPATIDDYVSENNPVRVIDAFVDSLDMHSLEFDKSVLKETGRPPYAPQDLLKLYIYGYFNKIRSSRNLEKECNRNIEVIWLMKDLHPDHKTIARFRHDNSKALKETFKAFVKLCAKCGLYGKKVLSIDGSKFKGCNSKERNFNSKKLNERIANIDIKIEKYLSELEDNDNIENEPNDSCNIKEIISELTRRREYYQKLKEELDTGDQTQISLTDSDCRRMNNATSHTVVVGYNVQTAVDSKNGLIAAYNVTNQSTDMGLMCETGLQAKGNLEIDEGIDLLADKGYNSSTDIANCYANGMKANVCMDIEEFDICIETNEENPKPESHIKGRCTYLKERNVCLCPMGEILYPRTYRKDKRCAKFYNSKACRKCKCRCTIAMQKQFEVCMPSSKFTKKYDIKGLHTKQIRIKPDKDLLKQRKCLSEHPFGVVKRDMDADYLLTRGFKNIDGEFALAFMVFNMKRALTLLGTKKLIDIMRTV